MKRRALLAALAIAMTAPAGSGWAQNDPLEAAFNALSAESRRHCQIELQMAGLYAGALDGAFGKGTRAGLVEAARKIAATGKGDAPDITTLEGASTFVRQMSVGAYMNPLYDDGAEG